MKLSVDKRYATISESCRLWRIMEGYNNWKLLTFKQRAGCDSEELYQCWEYTLQGMGCTLSETVVDGNYGAYAVDNDADNIFYVMSWDGDPWEVLQD